MNLLLSALVICCVAFELAALLNFGWFQPKWLPRGMAVAVAGFVFPKAYAVTGLPILSPAVAQVIRIMTLFLCVSYVVIALFLEAEARSLVDSESRSRNWWVTVGAVALFFIFPGVKASIYSLHERMAAQYATEFQQLSANQSAGTTAIDATTWARQAHPSWFFLADFGVAVSDVAAVAGLVILGSCSWQFLRRYRRETNAWVVGELGTFKGFYDSRESYSLVTTAPTPITVEQLPVQKPKMDPVDSPGNGDSATAPPRVPTDQARGESMSGANS